MTKIHLRKLPPTVGQFRSVAAIVLHFPNQTIFTLFPDIRRQLPIALSWEAIAPSFFYGIIRF
jgi:hypothetical protein